MEEQNFDEWWNELKSMAAEAEWKLGEKETYKEFYDDGDSPSDALDMDMESCDDDGEDD